MDFVLLAVCVGEVLDNEFCAALCKGGVEVQNFSPSSQIEELRSIWVVGFAGVVVVRMDAGGDEGYTVDAGEEEDLEAWFWIERMVKSISSSSALFFTGGEC